jgi:hypothetical protein
MSEAGRTLKVGDEATTTYNHKPWKYKAPTVRVRIEERMEGIHNCQSHILFDVRVIDGQRERLSGGYMDADWFEPVK